MELQTVQAVMGRAVAVAAMLLGLVSVSTGDVRYSTTGQHPMLDVYRLVAFDSCDTLLTELRRTAKESVHPWGFGPEPCPACMEEAQTDPGGGSAGPEYSGTNTQHAAIEEPDLVKTDGRKIVTAVGGVLRVVDVASRRLTGSLNLGGGEIPGVQGFSDLLLAGDRVLLLDRYYWPAADRGAAEGAMVPPGERPIAGARITLVDIAGPPRLIGTYRVDGGLVDARQVGDIARVVVRSAPRISFHTSRGTTETNRAVIDGTPLRDWLPRYATVDAGGNATTGQVGCTDVSGTHVGAGEFAALITVLTFDLSGHTLGSGEPVSVIADGDVVYANGSSLYVANGLGWHLPAVKQPTTTPDTELYKFDIGGRGKPAFVAEGEVPGHLRNGYALSEWDGHLRVASATNPSVAKMSTIDPPVSGVYVLRADGRRLVETGRVTLGNGERISAVRFVGETGYVVMSGQTDLPYAVDLRDPANPRVADARSFEPNPGYLHPIAGNRLLAVGTTFDGQGRPSAQVSLFDVRDAATPKLLDRYNVEGVFAVTREPHAFLYWPATGALAMQLVTSPFSRLLVLAVGDAAIAEVGSVQNPGFELRTWAHDQIHIQRSLIIDQTLWSLSGTGLKASDLRTLANVAWFEHL